MDAARRPEGLHGKVADLGKMANPGDELRRLMSEDGAIPVAGVFNPLSALIAEQVGFRALYFSGAAFSASLGIPDIGLFTLDELTTAVRWVTKATTLPLIVDADTGFGEAVNVYRTVADLEAAGAAGIQIEDQVMPKRCGHLDGKQIVSVEEFAVKIRAATEARKSSLIIARTDSKAVYGMDEAARRGKLYLEAGADIIFPEALESEAEFGEYSRLVDAPTAGEHDGVRQDAVSDGRAVRGTGLQAGDIPGDRAEGCRQSDGRRAVRDAFAWDAARTGSSNADAGRAI